MYGLGANIYSNLPSLALSESFSRPLQPLKVSNRAGSPSVTAAMTGNNNGGGGGGGRLGPGSMAGMNQGVIKRVFQRSSGSGAVGGSRLSSEFVDAEEEEEFDYTKEGSGRGCWGTSKSTSSFLQQALQPLSTSFNQRGAGNPPQRIIEENETLSNNSNAPYPVTSHPYPGAGAGGGSTSRSGSGGMSRNGSGTINLVLGNASNLSADTRARSQHEVPGLGGEGMAGEGGGGGYALSITGACLLSWPILLAGAHQAEVKAGRKEELVNGYLVKVYHTQKLITAGLVPTLILFMKTRAASSGEGLDFVLMALGALSYNTISSNTIFRTNTTTTLIELFTSSYSDEISALSIWCLTRICRSAEILHRG
ncbi:hypothetical protein K435DRAFT_941953 [Dendrothele bispora CBS 962.96]|uniref:Uncharacterized protein n=1 Tax=Dendrothele bispora (strain CBS 962.96) TaxID=1314807 RepID=A0A4S8KVB6_DENBC|nr:hypothetical protein K435DRAFT_941953 [Dendrothele bispora CBS 962.96]